MNYAIILAGGTGQRMRTSGVPKQFLNIYGKPIIVHTLEKFENCDAIDSVVIACNVDWIEYLNQTISNFSLKKMKAVVAGGYNRQASVYNGLAYLIDQNAQNDDIVVIHDSVRPLVSIDILSENVRVAKQYGSVMTVRPAIESVVVTDGDLVDFEGFMKRDSTYSLTSPQTFRLGLLKETFQKAADLDAPIPLLDAAIAYTYLGNSIHLIKENNRNIKITTPEDYYTLKAILELEESRHVWGL